MLPHRTVVCVLRAGGEYQPSHAHALAAQVRHWWPARMALRFVVLTDMLPASVTVENETFTLEVRPLYDCWPGWWSKLELFSAAQDDLGDFLYLDLDTMIVGSLLPLLRTRPLTLLADFGKPERLQSGCMWLPRVDRAEACAVWKDDPADHMQAFRGDGEFLDSIWRGRAQTWQGPGPSYIISYKYHVVPQRVVPVDARVVCFHGTPRPWASPMWATRAQ